MEEEDYREKALEYHRAHPRGKTGIVSTKATENAYDLALAYSPGVAYPCLEIHSNPDLAYEYTNRGNLLGIISNGTSILGLGDIGAIAGKPVMEGKSVLFKNFAGIDVFDIELNTKDADEFIRAVKLMEPTFGGINLEDIKAPECFYIEEKLIEIMDIPIFHDDQHGTAIITAAAIINYLILSNKKAENVIVVVNGAGAAAIAIAKLIIHLGVESENIFLVDSKGLITTRRSDLNDMKKPFARNTNANTLEDIMKNADIFIGVSKKDQVTRAMVKSMAKNPLILAMANPDPEISYPDAISVRDDLIMGTGRSDYPNQVNNLLGFPYIFRGALDMRARRITLEMKLAATYALAELARQEVPSYVSDAYGGEKFQFGKKYIIPKPFDPRVYYSVSSAVAEAAHASGVARIPYPGHAAYRSHLEKYRVRKI
ncbi:MAG TPA: malic enzyme-like NAD(P)-binding protein [Leptospiraceae bacterium]|nr:malic enzyme-like NAD(P)-binding protein [Leptospiraceae bacterium]HMX34407.1 malic enzyme-like NAD(P)-binding protein [Leptospiraceae bacterium]HMZ64624.1 malic enzyme-like NAD(P)-binding protein [Leptospiraceae bacterium]HNA09102.1 malic enzyme-like NAD(P)-binding protein [Leptospiraceae bacterium]HNC54879.1 malic enzyme-like NAD(P)-binding protein [Leptospiraceae bacterium]